MVCPEGHNRQQKENYNDRLLLFGCLVFSSTRLSSSGSEVDACVITNSPTHLHPFESASFLPECACRLQLCSKLLSPVCVPTKWTASMTSFDFLSFPIS